MPEIIALSWEDIYKKLSAPFEESAVQRTKTSETKKGYDTTGYHYQFIVNRLNEVMGIDGWNYEYLILERKDGASSSGNPRINVTVETKLTLTHDGKSVTKPCIGGHVSNNYTDALKGAITNSLKKTAALFGAGKQAYEKTIDDDHQDPDANSKAGIKPAHSKVAPELQTALNFVNSCPTVKALTECDERLQKNKKFSKNDKIQIAQAIQDRLAIINKKIDTEPTIQRD